MRDTTNVSFMLYPAELDRLNKLVEDKRLSKAQPAEWWRGLKLTRVPVRLIGNSVPPEMVEALVRANLPSSARRARRSRAEVRAA